MLNIYWIDTRSFELPLLRIVISSVYHFCIALFVFCHLTSWVFYNFWILALVLVRVSIPAQTSWPRSKLGRKGFIRLTLPCCCSSPKEVRTGNQAGQELMQRPWRDVLYWFASPGLLSMLSYRTQDYHPPTRGPSPLITNWENALQLDLMEAFPQLKLLSL